MVEKPEPYYVDVRDSAGNWQVGKVVSTSRSLLNINWVGIAQAEFQVESDSMHVRPFREHTRGLLKFETPRVNPSQEELRQFVAQLNPEHRPHDSTHCFRGSLLFYTQDYFQNPGSPVTQDILQVIAQLVTAWFEQSTINEQLRLAWYEVLLTLQFLVGVPPQSVLQDRQTPQLDNKLYEAIWNFVKNNQLGLEVLLEIPVLPVTEFSQKAMYEVFKALSLTIGRLTEAQSKVVDIEKFANALFSHGTAAERISPEELPETVVSFCFHMMTVNFIKCLEALRFLSRQTLPLSRGAADVLAQQNFIGRLITPEIHRELLKNSTGLFRRWAPLETRKILNQLFAVIDRVVNARDFFEFTWEVFSKHSANAQQEMYRWIQENQPRNSSQIHLLLTVTLCLDTFCHEQFIVSRLLEDLEHIKEPSVIVYINEKLAEEASVKLRQGFVQGIHADPSLLSSHSCLEVTCAVMRAYNDVSLKQMACQAVTVYLNDAELADDHLNYMADLISLVASTETNQLFDFPRFLARLQAKSESVLQEFIIKIVQNGFNKELLESLIDSIASQDRIGPSQCASFIRLFEQLNIGVLANQTESEVLCQKFFKQEALVTVYFKTEASVRLSFIQRLHQWLSIFSPQKSAESRHSRISLFLETLAETDWAGSLNLLHSLVFPSRGSGLNVSILENDTQYVISMGIQDPVYALRHVIADRLRTPEFTLFRGDHRVSNKEYYTVLKDYFPCEFRVRFERDPSYFPPAESLQHDRSLRDKLVNSLCNDALFQQCRELLQSLYIPCNWSLPADASTLPWHFYSLEAGLDRPLKLYIGAIPKGADFSRCQAVYNAILLKRLKDERMQGDFYLNFVSQSVLVFLKYPEEMDDDMIQNLTGTSLKFDQETLQKTLLNVLKEPCSLKRKIVLEIVVPHFQWSVDKLFEELKNACSFTMEYQTLWTAAELCPEQDLQGMARKYASKLKSEARKQSDISIDQPNECLRGLLRLLLKLREPLNLKWQEIVKEELENLNQVRFLHYSVLKPALEHLEITRDLYQQLTSLHTSLRPKNGHQAWNCFEPTTLKHSSSPTGIQNLGASCHLSSILQQLQTIPELLELVQAHRHQPLSQELTRVFAKLKLSCKNSISIANLFALLKGYDGEPLNPREQMDVDEVFGILMNTLEAEIGKTALQPLFTGEVQIRMQCSSGHVQCRTEEFVTFPIGLSKNIETSLQNWAAGERFEGENMYFCEQCGVKRDAVRTPYFAKLPQYLLFTLKRFDFDYETMERVKLHSYFEVPQTLVFPCRSFTLSGAIVHIGCNATGGHYIAYVQNKGTWKKFDDTKVTRVDWETVKQDVFGTVEATSGYFLVYKANDCPSVGPVDWPRELKREISLSNSRTFAKRLVFSKPYAEYAWQLAVQTRQPYMVEFAVPFLLHVRLRILEQYPDKFEEVYQLRECLRPALAEALVQANLFQEYVLECPVRIVRKALLELFRGWNSSHELGNQLLSAIQSLSCDTKHYIADGLELAQACNAGQLRVTPNLLQFAMQTAKEACSLRMTTPVFAASEDWSLHLIYQNLPPTTSLAQTTEFLKSLKSFKEAEALAFWAVTASNQLQELWQHVWSLLQSSEVSSVCYLSAFFFLMSFRLQKTCFEVLSSLWKAFENSVGKMIALFEAVFLCSAKYKEIETELLNSQYKALIQQYCNHYKQQTSSQFVPGCDVNQLNTVLAYLQQVESSQLTHPEENVNPADPLEYFDSERNIAEDLECLQTLDDKLLLLKKGEQILWMHASDKRLRRRLI